MYDTRQSPTPRHTHGFAPALAISLKNINLSLTEKMKKLRIEKKLIFILKIFDKFLTRNVVFSRP